MSMDDATTTPIGSGDYEMTSWTRGTEIVLTKVQGDSAFNTIIWRILPEASTRAAELMAGNVDIITNVAPDQMDVINANGNATVEPIQGTRRMYVGFNLSDEMATQPGGDAIQSADVLDTAALRAINREILGLSVALHAAFMH